jgi:plasmid stabilization system protein ParE
VPTKTIELHEEAAADYDAAFDWYLERSPDAARAFDAEFERALGKSHRHLNVGHAVCIRPADFCSSDSLIW